MERSFSGDVAAAVGELKAKPGGELQVHGSGNLVRWLLDNQLVDEITLLVYPVVVGQGTRLFPDTAPDSALDLADSRTAPSGVSIQVYPPPGARSTQRPRPTEAAAMAHMELLWPRLAELPLVVESCEYDRLHAVLAHEFQRVTTHVRLVGADGLGEDVSVHGEDGSSLHETHPALPLAGEWTLAGFCDHLATLDPWPKPPAWEAARRFRNWAFESAALDLALRQAGRVLHDVLGLEPRPVRFVNSLSLGEQPSIEHVRRRLARSP